MSEVIGKPVEVELKTVEDFKIYIIVEIITSINFEARAMFFSPLKSVRLAIQSSEIQIWSFEVSLIFASDFFKNFH